MTINQLKWQLQNPEGSIEESDDIEAEVIRGFYAITPYRPLGVFGGLFWVTFDSAHTREDFGYLTSVEEGKRVCQKHWEETMSEFLTED